MYWDVLGQSTSVNSAKDLAAENKTLHLAIPLASPHTLAHDINVSLDYPSSKTFDFDKNTFVIPPTFCLGGEEWDFVLRVYDRYSL